MIEVLKQALEAIDIELSASTSEELELASEKLCDARESLRQAIAELESQEPFGIWHQGATDEESDFYLYSESGDVSCPTCIKLYTTPPQRTWVGLTDEEMYLNCPNWLSQEQCKAWIQQIEAKLKEKNT
jgi:hypothetical protein